jgi:hypothetical protein
MIPILSLLLQVPASLYSPARRATTSAMSTRRSSARRSSTAAGPGASSTSGSGARMSSTDAGGHVQQRRRSSVGARGSERRSSAGEGSPQRRLSRQESYLRVSEQTIRTYHGWVMHDCSSLDELEARRPLTGYAGLLECCCGCATMTWQTR